MAASTSNIENIPTQTLFQASYIMPILYLGAFDNSLFEKTNISKFLKRLKNIYNNYQVFIPEKICHLP